MEEEMGLTIIVPVYNEEECLGRFCQEMNAFLSCTPIPTTVLFVYDGSKDGSQKVIARTCAGSTKYRYLQLDHNYGITTQVAPPWSQR